MASKVTGVSNVSSPVCSGGNQRNHQRSPALTFVRGIRGFPSKRVSSAENASIWWRHHGSIWYFNWGLKLCFTSNTRRTFSIHLYSLTEASRFKSATNWLFVPLLAQSYNKGDIPLLALFKGIHLWKLWWNTRSNGWDAIVQKCPVRH